MSFIQEATKLHLNQQYSDDYISLNIDEIKRKYTSMPHETTYIVHCPSLDIEYLDNNLEILTGSDAKLNNPLGPLYDHVDNLHYDKLTHFILKVLDFGFSANTLKSEKDWIRCIYKSKCGRIIMKTTCALDIESNGKMRYTLGRLTDLTGLIQLSSFRYNFQGPNQERLWSTVKGLNTFDDILTSREKEVLTLIGSGLQNSKIADILHISRHTASTHRKNIIKKLEAGGSYEAYNKAVEMGILR